ncbi:unnamed protein product (macronuclear) [Paramecium tetraurelia]|uniref:Uncharacterized protein n=1 Tax=Paramecium tetraurelia TaxID=5888 RepID=A0CRJ2_PARTE|nr:uncharacterized protein GSPATT00009724001 [Paramecium tetraurelia]CAK73409.1 unnamed protein product [Paramecium tetraurelia]|eukprot:XP_001440806.1 hypothetical protein (macronuclear) [Paramecium tetraurelia strain d4-2]
MEEEKENKIGYVDAQFNGRFIKCLFQLKPKIESHNDYMVLIYIDWSLFIDQDLEFVQRNRIPLMQMRGQDFYIFLENQRKYNYC